MTILETDSTRLLTVVRALLEQKGIVSTAEVRERMALTDNASPGQGAYPRAVLGYPPFWYKSAGFRARAVRDPRGLLATEWKTIVPDTVKLRVVDSTADYRWMVLPTRPAGTENWDEARLVGIVRESDMIGVTIPTI